MKRSDELRDEFAKAVAPAVTQLVAARPNAASPRKKARQIAIISYDIASALMQVRSRLEQGTPSPVELEDLE